MKTIITTLLLLLTLTMSAQFDPNSGTDTGDTIKIENNEHKILETAKGSPYIVCNSPRTKNDYAVWIGTKTDKEWEGKPVRKSRSGKYFVLIVSPKSNNPYPKYIKELNSQDDEKSHRI